jgi:hypothetical protein
MVVAARKFRPQAGPSVENGASSRAERSVRTMVSV